MLVAMQSKTIHSRRNFLTNTFINREPKKARSDSFLHNSSSSTIVGQIMNELFLYYKLLRINR